MKKLFKTPLRCVLGALAVGAIIPLSIGAASEKAARLESILDGDASFLDKMPNLVWAHDPFERLPGYGLKKSSEALPRLEAVFYSSSRPSAMLNGDEYEVGERIGDYLIAEIGRNYVLLEKGQSLVELVIGQDPDDADANIMIREHRVRTR